RGGHHAELTGGRDIDRAARHRGAVDAGNVGRGLGSADPYGIALSRRTQVSNVDVVTPRRQVVTRQIPLRNVVGASRVSKERLKPNGSVVIGIAGVKRAVPHSRVS